MSRVVPVFALWTAYWLTHTNLMCYMQLVHIYGSYYKIYQQSSHHTSRKGFWGCSRLWIGNVPRLSRHRHMSLIMTEIREVLIFLVFTSLSLDYWTRIRIYELIRIRCIIWLEFGEITQNYSEKSNSGKYTHIIFNILKWIDFHVNKLT